MNEADLYNIQRRKFQIDNLNKNIKTMKKNFFKLKYICKLNKRKVNAFES